MATIRTAIVADIVALLNAGSPPVAAKRSYTFAVDLSSAKSIIVYGAREEEPDAIGGNRMSASHVRRRFHVIVECRAKGTATTKADEEVDALAAWVVKTVAGKSKGVTEGKLYHLIVEGETVLSLDQADHAYCLASVGLIAEYQSKVNDPETWE